MKLTSSSFGEGEPIPGQYALCVVQPETHVTFGANMSPALAWNDVPAATKSLVLICHDRDAPSKRDDVNLEGRSVPAELPRVDFFHWVLVDLPLGTTSIATGAYSDGVTPKGKPGPAGPGGTRQGLNSYTEWFAGDADMEGEYFGYDGPCPPWNDEIGHHYDFTIYALDVERCPVEGKFRGPDIRSAIEGHILGQARITCTYSLNPVGA